MKKILVLATDYPNLNGDRKLYYIHSRNLYYKKQGIEVTVLNFNSETDYFIDGIEVITLDTFNENKKDKVLILSHASNLRNHYAFLKKNKKYIEYIIFFYHGHEILHLNNNYPKPYNYVRKSKHTDFIQNRYDDLKIFVWRKFLIKNKQKLQLVFVSNWMKENFFIETKINKHDFCGRFHIINNAVGQAFLQNQYSVDEKKEYDFITVRNNFDGSTYCIDLLVEIAEKMPNHKFLLIGKGNYFKHNTKTENLMIITKDLSHDEIIQYLNKSKVAIMPTKHDTQGLMSCEIASYGIDLVTSDIKVCKEIFSDFSNVYLVENNSTLFKNKLLELLSVENKIANNDKNLKYSVERTTLEEVKLIKDVLKKIC